MRNKIWKRSLSLLLALFLLCALLSHTVSSTRADELVYSGVCGASGDNLTWTFDPDTGMLTIEGSGDMMPYYGTGSAPWKAFQAEILTVSFPEGLTYVGSYAFTDHPALNTVTFPQGEIKSIGNNAFQNCTSLAAVHIPSVGRIEPEAFSGCTALTEATVSGGLTVIQNNAFYKCTALTAVTLPEDVTTIEQNAFWKCSQLAHINLPEGLTTIEQSAFYMTGLLEVHFPSSLTTLGYRAFSDCTRIAAYTVAAGNPAFCTDNCGVLFNADRTELIYYPGGRAGSYAIPEGVASIYEYAFRSSAGLTEVSVPESMTVLSSGAFAQCTGLRAANLPESLTEIGNNVFFNCYRLETVNLPNSVALIGYSAFYKCAGLKSVVLPSHLTTINPSAFGHCTGLEEVEFNEGLTTIGEHAFNTCPALRAVVLKPGVTSIGENAFYGCESVTTLVLPEGIVSLPWNSFCGCKGVKELVFPASLTSLRETAFAGCKSIADLYYAGTQEQWEVINRRPSAERIHMNTAGPESHWTLSVTAPTCTEPGANTETCVCGFTRAEPIPALGHEYENGVCVRCGSPQPSTLFHDVADRAYYAEAVVWAFENGITTGTGTGTFSPNKACTREQIMTMLWRTYGSPEPAGTELPFTDVKAGAYYEDAVRWAYYHTPQITAGAAAGIFGVGQTCNRAQVVTFLWAAAGKPEPTTAENPFEDVAETDYYYKAVLWAVENGVTSGTTPTTFSPNAPCTRAQVVTFLYKAAG